MKSEYLKVGSTIVFTHQSYSRGCGQIDKRGEVMELNDIGIAVKVLDGVRFFPWPSICEIVVDHRI